MVAEFQTVPLPAVFQGLTNLSDYVLILFHMSTPPPDPLDLPEATQRRLGRLEEIAEIGMDLMRGQRRWAGNSQ